MNWSKVRDLFGIDPRSLAVLRIGLGLLMLIDTAVRWTDIRSMYAGDALMSIETSRQVFQLPTVWYWSLHNLSGRPEYQATLLLVAGAAAVALVLGWRTWWANLICWVLLASVHVRAPLTPNGGDMLLRMMLFWSLFAPLGRVWSLDALRALRHVGNVPLKDRFARVVSFGTAALMIQLVLMYFFTGIFKSNEDWFTGKGLHYALSLDCYLRPLGQTLLGFPELLKWVTWATLGLELATPFIVFCPWQTARLRLVMLASYVALHVGIELSLTVGLFSAASIVAWAVFLPSEFWNSRLFSWIGRKVTVADAASVRGTSSAPAALSARLRLSAQGLCAFLLLYTIAANIASLFPASDQAIPPAALRLGQATNILQRWDMFGRVPRNDGWYVAKARLRDGSLVDILRGGTPYDEAKPQLVSAILPNQHWRYFFQALAQPYNRAYRQEAAEHLYRAWNARHEAERQIVSLELMYFSEDTDRDLTPGDSVIERFAQVTSPDADLYGTLQGDREPWLP